MWIHWIMVRKWYWQDEPYGPMKSIISECAHQPQLATAAGKLSGSDQIHHCTCCPGQPRFPAANVPFFPREIVKFLPGLRPAAIGVPKIKTLKSKIQIHSANKTVLYPPPRSCRVTCYPQNCELESWNPQMPPLEILTSWPSLSRSRHAESQEHVIPWAMQCGALLQLVSPNSIGIFDSASRSFRKGLLTESGSEESRSLRSKHVHFWKTFQGAEVHRLSK